MPNLLSIDQQQSKQYCLRYLVPLQWYQQYQDKNQQKNTVKFDYNEQRINLNMKTYFFNNIMNLVKEYQNKNNKTLNNIDIDNKVINPKLCINTKWKPISQQFYQQIKLDLNNNNIKLPLYYLSNQQQQKQIQISITTQELNKFIEVKLLLCSQKQNHYIYGYFNIQNNIKLFILNILKFYQYSINEKSRIMLINENYDIWGNYKWKQYEFKPNNKLINGVILVHGLIKQKQKQKDNFKQQNYQKLLHDYNYSQQQQTIKLSDSDNNIFDDEFHLPQQQQKQQKNNKLNLKINLNNITINKPSNHIKAQRHSFFQYPPLHNIPRQQQQATMADEQTLSLSQHTMSTGAQTPFEFPLQDQDWNLFRQYQNYGLFGQNLIDQIINMKEYAKQAIYSQLIEVPFNKFNNNSKLKQQNGIMSKNINSDNVNISQSQSQSQSQQLCHNSNNFIIQLSLIAQSIQDNIFKRKIYQKQIVKDNKQIHKQSFLYNKPSLSSRSSSIDSKQITSTKTIESQRIINNINNNNNNTNNNYVNNNNNNANIINNNVNNNNNNVNNNKQIRTKIHFTKGKQNY